jgi:hypothetical protein
MEEAIKAVGEELAMNACMHVRRKSTCPFEKRRMLTYGGRWAQMVTS